MKFSIIVPVYNTYKYVDKCLNSIKNQTYDNFEVIIINDGSTDNSIFYINKYLIDKRFKLYNKQNTGLANTRNYGVKVSSGDYFIFVDSDDYIKEWLLEVLNKTLISNKNLDIIKYEVIIKKGLVEEKTSYIPLTTKHTDIIFMKLCSNKLFTSACCWCFRRNMWQDRGYMFEKDKYHEDFGLIPYVIVNSKNIRAIDYAGYYYNIREESITTSKSMLTKRYDDILYFYDKLIKKIENDKGLTIRIKSVFKSFLVNSLLEVLKGMDNIYLNIYLKEVKRREVYKHMLNDNIGQAIKQLLIKTSLRWYIYFTRRLNE